MFVNARRSLAVEPAVVLRSKVSRIFVTLLLALAPVAAAGLIAAPASHADSSSGQRDVVTHYYMDVELDKAGNARVEIDFNYDFGTVPARGPAIAYPVRYDLGDDTYRYTKMSNFRAASSTGAPARVNLEEEGNVQWVRLGEQNGRTVTGEHHYQLAFQIDGMVNTAEMTEDLEEFYFDVIGAESAVEFQDVRVKVTAPGAPDKFVCYAGYRGSADPCSSIDAEESGTIVATQAELRPRQPFSVIAAYPIGTFPDAKPDIRKPHDPAISFRPNPVSLAAAGAVLVGGGAFVRRKLRRDGTDRVYAGLTPGLTPGLGQETREELQQGKRVVAVQFEPPRGSHPGQLGTLLDEKADPKDVTATIIDLAVRGFIRIEEVARRGSTKPPKDWTLVQESTDYQGLEDYETYLLEKLFSGRTEVQLSSLETTFASTMQTVQSKLYKDVTNRGWFVKNPNSVRMAWMGIGVLLLVPGIMVAIGAALLLEVPGLSYLGIAMALLGLLVLSLSGKAPARTAAGSATLAQLEGFKLYLETAEANQIQFEESQDIFSKYLPYAIIFDVADRWSKVFADLAARGVNVAEPSWYVPSSGFNRGLFWSTYGMSFGSRMSSFSARTTTAVSAPAPPSASGSSGFSSGGGFSGGGMGGGSVGRW